MADGEWQIAIRHTSNVKRESSNENQKTLRAQNGVCRSSSPHQKRDGLQTFFVGRWRMAYRVSLIAHYILVSR